MHLANSNEMYVKPADSRHLTEESKLVDIDEVTDAGRCAVQLTYAHIAQMHTC